MVLRPKHDIVVIRPNIVSSDLEYRLSYQINAVEDLHF